MKYNLIVEKQTLGQKGLTVANYLKKEYKNVFDVSNILKKDCNKNIILSQRPIKYKTGLISEYLNAIHFIRPAFIKNYSLNYATNGFSIFKENNNYKFFIPMLYEYKNEFSNTNELNIGYYYTTYRETEKEFLDFIKDNENKISNITILNGNEILKLKLLNINSKLNIKYSHNKDDFFSAVSHVIVPMSRTFVDPWPTVFEEAVRCNKQIIILKHDRNWEDGINDICSCIQYHTKIDNVYHDNSNCSINKFDLKNFYDNLTHNNFEYTINSDKYKTFDEFLMKIYC